MTLRRTVRAVVTLNVIRNLILIYKKNKTWKSTVFFSVVLKGFGDILFKVQTKKSKRQKSFICIPIDYLAWVSVLQSSLVRLLAFADLRTSTNVGMQTARLMSLKGGNSYKLMCQTTCWSNVLPFCALCSQVEITVRDFCSVIADIRKPHCPRRFFT